MIELADRPLNRSGGNSFSEALLPVFAGRNQALPSFLGKLIGALDRRTGETQLFGTGSAPIRMMKKAPGKVIAYESRNQFPPKRRRRTPRSGIMLIVVAKAISLGHAYSARLPSKSLKAAIFSSNTYEGYQHLLIFRTCGAFERGL